MRGHCGATVRTVLYVWGFTTYTGKTGKTVQTLGSETVHTVVLAWFDVGDER